MNTLEKKQLKRTLGGVAGGFAGGIIGAKGGAALAVLGTTILGPAALVAAPVVALGAGLVGGWCASRLGQANPEKGALVAFTALAANQAVDSLDSQT